MYIMIKLMDSEMYKSWEMIKQEINSARTIT